MKNSKGVNNKNKKKTCQIVDFAVRADNWVKSKESEKKCKYLDLARELKKLLSMQVTVIPIVTGAHGIGRGTGSLGNKRTKGNHPD